MTIWNSTDFGWEAGQDISDEFQSLLLNQFKAGDTLVLEDTYTISGSYMRLPTDFTLTAEYGGGFDVLSTATDTSALFVLSDGVTVDNVSFDAVNAPDTGITGANPTVGTDYHGMRMLLVDGDNVTIEDSSFEGNVSMFVDVNGGDNFTIDSSVFEGGFYQVRLVGSADDATVTGSHFHHALGDGIKTTDSNGESPLRLEVIDSLFESNNRDGIDTAGGFTDGRVVDSVFYDNGVSGIDIKSMYRTAEDLVSTNSGITISGSQFIDNNNGIVISAVDKAGILTAEYDHTIPHDIYITDSIFEADDKRAFLIKDGYDITWDNITLLGNITEARIMTLEAPFGLSGTNVTGESSTGDARNLSASDLWSNEVGPVDGGEAVDGASPVCLAANMC